MILFLLITGFLPIGFLIFLLFYFSPNEKQFKRCEDEYKKNKDYVINYYKENKNSTTTNEIKEQSKNYNEYYRPKRYLISKNELNFYSILLEIAKELDLILFSQVSLYNILETRPNLDYRTKTIYFNKIASKSIDFVLVDKNDCRIKLCIELDDSTHKQQKRIERDKFINELFKSLEINLLRYPSYHTYYKDTLKTKIQENIDEKKQI